MNATTSTDLYRVKGSSGWQTEIHVVREYPQGYDILISTTTETRVRESAEFISRDMFETCIRTGYLVPDSRTTAVASGA
jgi:hypothetical protein